MGYGMQGANQPARQAGSMQKQPSISGYKAGNIQNYTPQQMQLFQQLFQNVSPDSYLAKLAGGDESTFNQIEAPAMRDFSSLQGQTASRFSGMGLGGRGSSGFKNTINQQTSNFAQDLQARRNALQQGAIKDLHGLSNELLNQRPYDNYYTEKQSKEKSGWGGLAGAGIGALGGFFAGGPPGALAGGRLGYNVGSGF